MFIVYEVRNLRRDDVVHLHHFKVRTSDSLECVSARCRSIVDRVRRH